MKHESHFSFLPKSVTELRTYSLSRFFKDLIAGVTVGLVALPLAMAFAISSGVLPQSGIYCAIVAGFIISALGGSRLQIGGPTGAFVVVVSGIVQKHGIDGLFMCTMLAGVLLVILGVTGLGTAVKYIPRPVVIGFTNGIAILIASTQIKDFLGLKVDHVPGDFLGRMQVLAANLQTFSLPTFLLSGGLLVLIVLIMLYARQIPGAIVAMLVGTGLAWVLKLPVETIETRFGGIPVGLPEMHLPAFRLDLVSPLLPSIITVAMLGAIESLLSAVVADRMSGDKHNPNVELAAQGIANIVSPLFGGLPATGAIARTATNIRSGATSPAAGMIHALTLLGILLFAVPLAKHIPLCVLSAILFVVAYNMGEWSEIPSVLAQGKGDAAIWLVTLTLTVFADLTVAVAAGMMLAALVFIQRVTATTTVTRVDDDYLEEGRHHSLQDQDIPEGVAIFRIHGPFLFGASDKLEDLYIEWDSLPKIIILRLRNMTAIDGTGLHALEDLATRAAATQRQLILCGAREQPLRMIQRSKIGRLLPQENIAPNVEAAIERAKILLASPGTW